jgi:muramidase (phage lysozyme)
MYGQEFFREPAMDGNDDLVLRKRPYDPELWPGSGIRVPGWNPDGVLGGVVDLHPPVSGLEWLMSPEQLADAGISPAGSPAAEDGSGVADQSLGNADNGLSGIRPSGWDASNGDSGGQSPVTIDQVDPGKLAIGWAPGTEPMRNLLERISAGEGTSDAAAHGHYPSGSGYDVAYGYRPTPMPLSQMSLDDVDKLQSHMGNPAPMGKYQIMQRTMADLRHDFGLNGSEIFSTDLQDRMARRLLERRGWNAYVDGRIDAQEFQKRLGKEWDSIAAPGTGQTRSGHNPRTSDAEIRGAISQVVRRK